MEQIELGKCIGKCLVTTLEEIAYEDGERFRKQDIHRVLFKNGKKLKVKEAKYLLEAGCVCVGVECSTIGEEKPYALNRFRL